MASPSVRASRTGSFDTTYAPSGDGVELGNLTREGGDYEKMMKRGNSVGEVNVDALSSDLFEVNPFYHKSKTASRFGKNNEKMLMFEIEASGESSYKDMTLMELLAYVNQLAAKVDFDVGLDVSSRRNVAFSTSKAAALHQASRSTGAGTGVGGRNNNAMRSSMQSTSAGNLAALALESSTTGGMSGNPSTEDLSPSSAASGGAGGNGAGGGGGGSESAVPPQVVNLLRMRDLRRLAHNMNATSESTLLVRRHLVLFSLDPIRALVMADRVLLMVPSGADSILSELEKFITAWSSNAGGVNGGEGDYEDRPVSFEAHAYEALLTTVSSIQNSEYKLVENTVMSILKQFENKGCILSIESQEKIRELKNIVSEKMAKLSSFTRALEDVIEDDEAMALMNLSRLRLNPRLYIYPLSNDVLGFHEEVEELLESYLVDYVSTESDFNRLQFKMQSAEELVSLRLDTSRNQLLVVNTAFSILACTIAFGAYFTGVFGMNLDNTSYIQPLNNIFAIVFGLTGFIIIFGFLGIFFYLRWIGVLPTEARE